MRNLFVTIMMAVSVGLAGCSLFEEGDDPREAAISYFKKYVAAGNFSDALEVAEQDRLYTTATIRKMYRRWEREVARGNRRYDDGGAHVEAELARAGKWLRVDRRRVLAHATKALDEYLRNNDPWKADRMCHDFGLWGQRHHDLIVQYYSQERSDNSGFWSSHPLEGTVTRDAYDIAMRAGRWQRAEEIARRGELADSLRLAASRRHLQAQFEELLGRGDSWGAGERALAIAADPDAGIEPPRAQSVAERVWQTRMNDRQYVAAYRLALQWQLGADRTNRARREAFAYARRTGAYQLADRLPDGTIMILRDGT